MTRFLVVLLLAACTTAPAASDIDVQIRQTGADTLEHEVSEGVELEITVANRSAVPWRVESVAVQTMRTDYLNIPRRMERFDRTIAAGQEETLRRWWFAEATVDFDSVEIPVRIELYLAGPNGERRTETFSRMLDAWVTKPR